MKKKDGAEEDIHDLTESIKIITDEQYKAIVDKERYYEERELNIGKLQTGNRTKFKNRWKSKLIINISAVGQI